MRLPKLPAARDAWTTQVLDFLLSTKSFLETEDFHLAARLQAAKWAVTLDSPLDPEPGQVLTIQSDPRKAAWAAPPAGYTDEQAQDAVGDIAGPTSGPVQLTYNDAAPSLIVSVADMVGDSGAGGEKGLVPAPGAGDAAALKFLRADGTWAVPAGGGSTVGVWMPDAPPASPHACDDEFTTASLDAKWTEYDFASMQTVNTSSTRCLLRLTATGNGSDRLAGIYQTAPASEYVIYTKVGAVNPNTMVSGPDPGILLFQDATSSTGDVRALASTLFRGTPSGGYAASWTAYNTFASSTSINVLTPVRYLRVRVNGANWAADVSTDGISWYEGLPSTAIGWTPAHIGIGCDFFNNASHSGFFDFFRVQSGTGTSGIDATWIGRNVSVGV